MFRLIFKLITTITQPDTVFDALEEDKIFTLSEDVLNDLEVHYNEYSDSDNLIDKFNFSLI